MVRNGCNNFLFWASFFPFYLSNSLKNQNFEKMKQIPGDTIILHICTTNSDQMMYSSWDMVCDRFNCYFSFWTIFCPFTPRTAQKGKILKKWKIIWVYLHFTHVYQKLWSDNIRFLRYAVRQTDGWTDRKSGV